MTSSDFIRTTKRFARRIIGRPILNRSILIYHRVTTDVDDPWDITVSPIQFKKHLAKLRNKTVLPLREFVRLHIEHKLPTNAIAITFDDGYACNALVAAPILESFGYPATFFIVSEVINRQEEFWWDQLLSIFHAPRFQYECAVRLLPDDARISVSGSQVPPLLPRGFFSLWSALRMLSAEERYDYLNNVRNLLKFENKTRPTHRPMTPEELRSVAANPLFEIGGHTATHPSLPTLSPAAQQAEIISGAQSLEALIGKPIFSFAYPFGDWSPVTRDIVKAAGFECAVTTIPKRAEPPDNEFELPRRQAVNPTFAFF